MQMVSIAGSPAVDFSRLLYLCVGDQESKTGFSFDRTYRDSGE